MKPQRQRIGKDKAIAMYDSGWWEGKTQREIAEFQVITNELCIPFDKFHKAVEATIGRPVQSIEFGLNRDGLIDEIFNGTKPAANEGTFVVSL